MSNALLDALGFAGDVLDTPGAVVRSGLMGENPLQAIFDTKRRRSGRDVLEHYGVLGKNHDGLDGGDVAGFLAEMAFDPTNLVGGGLAKHLLKKAGAIKKANALSKTQRAMGFMPEEVAKATKIVDDAGQPLKTFHGTPHVFDKYDMAKADPDALYGKGIYTTADSSIADTYVGKGASETGFMSPVSRNDRAVADIYRRHQKDMMEADPEWMKTLSDDAAAAKHATNEVGDIINNGNPDHTGLFKDLEPHLDITEVGGSPKNIRMQHIDARNPWDMDAPIGRDDLLKLAAREPPGSMGRSALSSWVHHETPPLGQHVQNAMDGSMAEAAKDLGYDAITHQGGIQGGKKHKVVIALDPSQVYAPYIAAALKPTGQGKANALLAAMLGHNAARSTHTSYGEE